MVNINGGGMFLGFEVAKALIGKLASGEVSFDGADGNSESD